MPREAPPHPRQKSTLTVIFEARVRKSPRSVLIPCLEPLPVVPGPARRAPRRQDRVTQSERPFPSPIHPQLTHLPRPCLSLLRERTTNTLSATTSSNRSRAPAPARPPTSAFQEMATSQRGPKNQCVSGEKQLGEGATGHITSPPSGFGPSTPLDHLSPGRWAGLHPGASGRGLWLAAVRGRGLAQLAVGGASPARRTTLLQNALALMAVNGAFHAGRAIGDTAELVLLQEREVEILVTFGSSAATDGCGVGRGLQT